jgi:hypothetical protein
MEGGCHHQEITDVLVIRRADPHISPSTVEDEWKPLKSQNSRGAHCLPSHRSGTTSQARRVTPHKSPFLPPPSASSPVPNHATTSQTLTPHSYPIDAMKRSGSLWRWLSPTGSSSCQLSPTGSPSYRLSPSPFNRSSGATSSSRARDWVPPRDNQHFACMFTEALWGHTHGMSSPRSDTADTRQRLSYGHPWTHYSGGYQD